MEKFDYKKILVNGNEYECVRSKNGRIHLVYVENSVKWSYSFDDTMHERFLSKVSYFVTPEQMILEVKTIEFIDFETGFIHFTGRIKFDTAL